MKSKAEFVSLCRGVNTRPGIRRGGKTLVSKYAGVHFSISSSILHDYNHSCLVPQILIVNIDFISIGI